MDDDTTAVLGTVYLAAVAKGKGKAGLGELTPLPFCSMETTEEFLETHSGRWHSLFRLQPWNVPQGQEVLWLFPLYTGRQRGATREKTQKYYALKPSRSWGSESLKQLRPVHEKDRRDRPFLCIPPSGFTGSFSWPYFSVGDQTHLKGKQRPVALSNGTGDKDLVVRCPSTQSKCRERSTS